MQKTLGNISWIHQSWNVRLQPIIFFFLKIWPFLYGSLSIPIGWKLCPLTLLINQLLAIISLDLYLISDAMKQPQHGAVRNCRGSTTNFLLWVQVNPAMSCLMCNKIQHCCPKTIYTVSQSLPHNCQKLDPSVLKSIIHSITTVSHCFHTVVEGKNSNYLQIIQRCIALGQNGLNCCPSVCKSSLWS